MRESRKDAEGLTIPIFGGTIPMEGVINPTAEEACISDKLEGPLIVLVNEAANAVKFMRGVPTPGWSPDHLTWALNDARRALERVEGERRLLEAFN